MLFVLSISPKYCITVYYSKTFIADHIVFHYYKMSDPSNNLETMCEFFLNEYRRLSKTLKENDEDLKKILLTSLGDIIQKKNKESEELEGESCVKDVNN